ncbi:MAG: tetratricopeptide repeat protein [Planctomycetes bacterium]|nr:tetratricopeptide repeat protein [Planctomycetota bacterium]
MTKRCSHRSLLGILAWISCGAAQPVSGHAPGADEHADEASSPPLPTTLDDAHHSAMRGEYETAIEAYSTLISDPATAQRARVGLAAVRMRIGKYDDAIAALTGLGVERTPAVGTLLAQLYRIKGRYEDAVSQTRAVIQTDRNHAGARRLLGELLEQLGRRDEAIEVYRWFDRQLVEQAELPRDAARLTDTAIGFYRYSVLTQTDVPRRTRHVLHDLLQPAYEQLDRTFWPARIAAADLLRERFNNSEDDGSVSDYEAALRINPNLCEAQVGLGTVELTKWNFEEVDRRVERALGVNPNHAPAIHLLAQNLVTQRRYEQAMETCDRALAINDRDLAALSIRAAASACRYDEAEVARMYDRVRSVNPRCALYHRTLGDALGGIRQYAASERQYLEAIKLDGTDANTWGELGMMYMQWGLEGKARDALDHAWVLDPYNKRTKFTLDLLESLVGFERHETPHFIVRYDAARDPGLGEYVAGYLEEIYDEVVGDYDWPLKEKTIIEMFPTQRAFAVRITGKPWIHTVGACTGRVIAMASPRKSTELMGPYNFARVLKHEFTHTVTLAATRNRIPHWLTEGLAVMQENASRSFFWSELLAEAARRDALFTLESIDWAFVRPKRPTDRQMAYAQSEWMCEYIVHRFGYDSISAMLKDFYDGRTLSQVFAERFGLQLSEFDGEFRTWAKRQVAQWGFDPAKPEDVEELRAVVETNPDDAGLLGRLARAEFDEGEFDRALKVAKRAVELDPLERTALTIVAKVLMMLAEGTTTDVSREVYYREAQPLLEQLWKIDPTGWTAPKHLARIALRRKEPDLAIEPLKRLQRLCPMDPTSWRGLGGIYVERGNDEAALPQLLELVRIEEDDAEVREHLAEVYRHRGRLRESQYWYRQALAVDPFHVRLHVTLAEVSMQLGDTEAALVEYVMLTKLEPTNARHFENAAFAAHKLDDKVQAQSLARRAVELAPESPARSLLP